METLVRTAEAAGERSWRYATNQEFGKIISALTMHTANRLPADMAIRLDAAAARVEQLMSRYGDSVLAWAKKSGYDPATDSVWRKKMFQENDLSWIANGRVDYRRYMGGRYTDDMVNLVKAWARAREEMPKIIGYNGRNRYDERLRMYYDKEHPIFSASGQGRTRPSSYEGKFLKRREIEEAIDLEHAPLDKETPDIVILMHDLENQAKQHAFQPLENKNGNVTLKKDSLFEDLFKLSNDPKATLDQRDAAKTTLQLISGSVKLDNPVNKMLMHHTDAILTQNVGSAMQNLISLITLPNVSAKTMASAIQSLKTPEVQKLLREVRIADTISFQRELLDPNKLRFEEGGMDLYRASERWVRSATFVATAMDYAEKHGVPWADVLKGTDQGMVVRGRGLAEVRDTQGTAHKFSIRAGAKALPGSFYLKNAKLSELGRTAAQAKLAMSTGNFGPLATNMGIRLALGGGKMLLSPETAILLGRAVNMSPGFSQEQKDYAQAQLAKVQNGTEEVDLRPLGFSAVVKPPLQALDEMAGTNLSSRGSLFDFASLPGMEALQGKAAPIDLSSAVSSTGKAFNPNDTLENRADNLLRAGTVMSQFIPGNTFTVPGVNVKLSTPLVLKSMNAALHILEGSQGKSVDYNGTSVRVNPVTEIGSLTTGGLGPSGQIEKQRVATQGYDKRVLKEAVQADLRQYGKMTAGTNQLFDNYLRVHGGQDFKTADPTIWGGILAKNMLAKDTTALEKDVNEHAKTVLESAIQKRGDVHQRLQVLQEKIDAMKRTDPTRYGTLTIDGVLGKAAKSSHR